MYSAAATVKVPLSQSQKRKMRPPVLHFNKVSISSRNQRCKLRKYVGPSCHIYNLFGYNLLPYHGCAQVCVNVACFSLALISTVSFMLRNSRQNWIMGFISVFLEYCIIVVYCALQRTPHNFFGDMPIDDALGFGRTQYLKLRKLHNILIFASIAMICLVFIITCYFSPFYCTEETFLDTMLSTYILTAVHMYQIPRIVYFTAIYYRAKLLKKCMMASSFEIGRKINSEKLLMLYRGFLDGVDAAASKVDPMLLVSIFFSIPKVLSFLYSVLLEYNKELTISSLIKIRVLLVIQYIPETFMDITHWVLPFIPGVLNEMTSSQLHQLKLSLVHRLIDCQNKEDRKELEKVVRYIEGREFSYSVWRLVRVDGTLLLSTLSLCTTYFIVLVQFSNLYH